MKDLIPVPSKGTPLRASWGAAVANGMNAFASMSSPGMLAREGMAGTGAQPLPVNMRDRTASIQPRQFTLRARLETRQSVNSTEYRTVVEFYNFYNHEAVTWSGHSIPSQSGIVNGWNVCLSSEWSASPLSATTIYLNVRIDIEQNWGGTEVLPPKNTSFWNVSSTPIANSYSVGVNEPHIRHAYELGIVTSGFVRQITDGTFNFMDLAVFEGGGSGSGSEADADGTNYPMPFQYKRTDTVNQSTGDVTSSWSIVNNRFYWDGVEKTIADYTPSDTCTVYLVCRQTAPSSADPDPDWSFSLAESAGSAQSGGRVLNFKLYTFLNHLVTMDYRTTFLELNSPHKVARFEVSPPAGNAQQKIVLDAATSSPEISVTDGTNEIELKPSDLSNGNKVSVHTLTVNHADGTTDEYDVLADNDVEINEGDGGGGIESEEDSLSFITDIGYDISTGWIQVKTKTASLVNRDGKYYIEKVGPESDWIDKIETTPHSTGS